MKGFTIQAQLTSVKPLQGDIFGLNFHTAMVIDDQEKLTLINGLGQEGYLLFKEKEVQDEEIPKDESDFTGKTPSQRQRAILFSIWKQGIEGKGMEWRDYYNAKMDEIAEILKRKFD
jgi:hypothetical protein